MTCSSCGSYDWPECCDYTTEPTFPDVPESEHPRCQAAYEAYLEDVRRDPT